MLIPIRSIVINVAALIRYFVHVRNPPPHTQLRIANVKKRSGGDSIGLQVLFFFCFSFRVGLEWVLRLMYLSATVRIAAYETTEKGDAVLSRGGSVALKRFSGFNQFPQLMMSIGK